VTISFGCEVAGEREPCGPAVSVASCKGITLRDTVIMLATGSGGEPSRAADHAVRRLAN